MSDELLIGNIAGKIGRGLAAGLVATAVMTVSQMVEMELRGRKPSIAPAKAASKVLGVDDVLKKADSDQKQELSELVHFGYGTSWGGVRALLDVIGLSGASAALAQFAAIWTTAIVVMPSLEGSKPVNEWQPEEVVISAMHHVIYTAALEITYDLLTHESYEHKR